MRTLRPRTALLGVAAILLGSLAVVSAAAAPAAAEGDEPDGYASFYFQQYNDGSETGELPDCGSPNVNGEEDFARWSVGSSVTDGAHIDIGDEIFLRTTVYSRPADGLGDNGADPLRVNVNLTGPFQQVGTTQPGFSAVWHVGDGAVGPVGPFGPYGWEFDTNSDPGIIGPTHSDGAYVWVEIRIRATAPGQITLPRIEVSGHDETGGYDFSCPMDVPFDWIVDPPLPPTSGVDAARVDASYGFENVSDRNGGAHAVTIDVLQNDDDPNLAGGPGDPDEVRITDWSQSDLGGTVSCGTPQEQSTTTFGLMSDGPCTYTPPQDTPYFTNDAFRYALRSVSGTERLVTVTIDLVDNRPPSNGAYEGGDAFVVGFGTADSFELAPIDFEGDAVTCEQEQASAHAFVEADCSVTWTASNVPGLEELDYVACDQHDTLQGGALGTGVARVAGYELGSPDDVDAATSSRCSEFDVDVVVGSPLATLVVPPRGVSDFDVVDSGYASEGIGAYAVEIPVLANDTDLNGPDPSGLEAGDWTGAMELLDADGVIEVDGEVVGTATVIDLFPGGVGDTDGDNEGDLIGFTPADGFQGPVAFGYRVCEDPAQQDPAYQDDPNTPPDEGLPFCGVGKVNVFVEGNPAPVAADDEALTSSTLPITDLDVRQNDVDPQGQTLGCTPGPLAADPALVEAASIDAQCLVDLDPVVTAAGVAELTYEICDVHTLLPAFQGHHPATPYGEPDGRGPGDLANRCTTAVLAAEIVAPAPGDPGLLPLDPDPACADDAATTVAGTAIEVPVLVNDRDLDIGGGPGTLSVTGAGVLDDDVDDVSANGATVVPTADGQRVRYTPPAGFTGTDTFAYNAQDLLGQGCAATVTVTVGAVAGTGSGAGGGGTLPRTGGLTGGTGQLQVGAGLALLGFGLVLLAGGLRPARR